MALITRPTNWELEVAMGLREGYRTFSKFGYNKDIDSGTAEIIASQGGNMVIPTTGATLSIVSTSANDTSGGTGARQIIITGLDGVTGSEKQETITMNGTTPVVTTSTWIGINRARVAPSQAGTLQTNAGDITLTASTGGILAQIPLGTSITQQVYFTVPSDEDAYITAFEFDIGKAGGVAPIVDIKAYQFQDGVRYNLFESIIDVGVNGIFKSGPILPIKINAGAVWWLEAETNTNNTFVRARVEQYLIKTNIN